MIFKFKGYYMDEYNNIKNFLELYENTLKSIYLKGREDLGKGILYIDINNNNNGNCDTRYVNIDMIEGNDELKERVKTNDKIYYCVKDNDNVIFIER
tara:strand:- start:50 stop:340 length:291 start_codon:yes stop_codon:yes gene_type:complete